MKEITLNLTNDEALILTDFLLRFQDNESLSINHKSEEIALWNLGSLLESKVTELFNPNYSELIKAARKRLTSDSE